MRTASIRAALFLLIAAYLFLSPAFAVTDGWENSDPSRIDPIAAGKGRVSFWDRSVAEEMAELRAIRFDQWLCGKTE